MAEGTLDADGIVAETYTIGDAPPSLNPGVAPQQPIPGKTGQLRASLEREYVSSQPNQSYLNLVRVLPFFVDDLTADFGDDLYSRMMYDPIVSSAITTLKAAVLEEGINIRPSITDSGDPNYDTAIQLHDEVEEMMSAYAGQGFDDWLWEAADAIWRGNTCSEITYYVDTTIAGKKRYFLDRISSKPAHSYGYAIDTYSKTIGVMGLIPGVSTTVLPGNLLSDLEAQPNLLPREKFAVYTHRPRNEDPRGNSALRPVYNPWNLKMATIPEYAKWLRQFASPTLLGYTSPESMSLPLVYANGDPITGTSGDPVVAKTPEEVMLDSLIKVASGVAAVFPGGAKVTPIEMRGMGNPFLFAFKWIDEQINTGINGQTMTSMAPKYGTQALGGVQENTFDTIVHQIKAGIARMFWRDLLRNWVKYNFGKKFLPFTPSVTLGHVEEQDIDSDVTAFAAAGYTFHPSQFPGLDKRIGAPVRAPNWQDSTPPEAALQQQQAQSTQEQQAKAAEELHNGQTPQEREKAIAAHAEAQNAEWHNSVRMADELRQRTGIRVDPNTSPPSKREVEWMFGTH